MYPDNHGKLWTTEETNKLMREIRILTLDEIAINHKRTPRAIYLKLIREAAKLFDNDPTLNLYDLSIITTLKMKTILDGFEEIKYNKFFKEKKEYMIDYYNNNQKSSGVFNKIIITSFIMISIYLLKDYILPNSSYFQSFLLNDVI